MEQLAVVSVFAAAMLICVGAIATGFGFAILGSKFLESAARQPEVVPMLQGKMFLVAGLLDAVPMIGVGVAFIILYANPVVGLLG